MLTLSCVRVASARRLATRIGIAATLSVLSLSVVTLSGLTMSAIATAAYADGLVVGGCVGGRGDLNCVVRWGPPGDPYVRLVPDPTDEVEKKRAAEREHKWQERCRPVIAQDALGVPRYQYSAPGCEYGVID